MSAITILGFLLLLIMVIFGGKRTHFFSLCFKFYHSCNKYSFNYIWCANLSCHIYILLYHSRN